MSSIILVIISISLLAAFLNAGLNYVNLNQYQESKYEKLIESSLTSFSINFSAYKNLKGYSLPTSNWESELGEINQELPASISGNVWSYNNTSGKYYFCLSSSAVSENVYNAMVKVKDNRSVKTFVNTNCGANDATTSFSPPSSFPAQIALTYWIVK